MINKQTSYIKTTAEFYFTGDQITCGECLLKEERGRTMICKRYSCVIIDDRVQHPFCGLNVIGRIDYNTGELLEVK